MDADRLAFLSPTQRRVIRGEHVRGDLNGLGYCRECRGYWPCLTIRGLDAVEALESERDALAAEVARLRYVAEEAARRLRHPWTTPDGPAEVADYLTIATLTGEAP